VLVAVCALLGATVLDRTDRSVGVWVAARPLASGAPVATEDLVSRQISFADQADADRYLSADRPVPGGSTLARDIGRGELVPRTALSTTTGASVVEVPLSVDTDAVPSTVEVGDLVDVWVTPDTTVHDNGTSTGSQQARSALVFDDVAVLAAPRSSSSLGPSSTRQVIVGVGHDQQGRLPTALAALASGTVTLTSRR
jgi:hypothetical protein